MTTTRSEAVTVDVREDFRQGREPFTRIMAAVDGLNPGESLRLIAPIEPVPLFGVMRRRGFTHTAKQTDDGDWEVVFEPDPALATQPTASRPARPPCPAAPVTVEVDARGLEPPMPMVRILEAVAGLPDAGTLRARTDRRPMHLYAELEARGFRGESEEQPDGSFITHIRRA